MRSERYISDLKNLSNNADFLLESEKARDFNTHSQNQVRRHGATKSGIVLIARPGEIDLSGKPNPPSRPVKNFI
jgi:hypothetical protein